VTKVDEDLLEKVVKKSVKEVLKHWGCYQFWPVKASAIGAKAVDCLACIPVRITEEMVGTTLGVFVAIETKRTRIDKPTAAQAGVMEQVRLAGGGVALIHTRDMMEIGDQLSAAVLAGEAATWVLVKKK
jgi:ribosomal protein S19